MPKFKNSSAGLTPIYVQPSAPQAPPLSAEDLKQVNITDKIKNNTSKLYICTLFLSLDSRYVPKHG